MIKNIEKVQNEYVELLPSAIKHEYCRIFELLENGENYGAMMQLKDVAESILKMYASIGLSAINNKDSKSNEEIKLLFEITDKILSLGDWEKIIIKLNKCKIDEVLTKIYSLILKFCSPKKGIGLVEWRNKCLGHGALGYLNDENYHKDFVVIFDRINAFIEDYGQIIGKEIIIIEDLENNDVYSVICDKKISLYPFITIDDGKLFYFDTFIERKQKLDVLNYHYGIRKTHKNGDVYEAISSIHSDYAHIAVEDSVKNALSVENDIFLRDSQEILEKNVLVNDAEKAGYLESWLNKKINEYNKGVFFLQMPAGSGKTVCVQQLTGEINTEIDIDDTEVIAVYLNNTYNSDVNNILQELEKQFVYGKWRIKGNIPRFDYNSSNVKDEMANYLNSFYRVLFENDLTGNSKLLLVFDGLDELSDLSFYDYIPDSDMLDDNIYILLTSRPYDDLDSDKKQKIGNIKADITYNPDIYDSVLPIMQKHISRNMEIDDEKKSLYLSISKNNFAYLKFLMTYMQIIGSDMEETSNIKSAIHLYLKKVKRVYGEKYGKKLFLVLYIFANSSIGFTLKQLSLLLGENNISFELIGILQDIRGLIKLFRANENLYQICNIELKQVIQEVLEEDKLIDYEKDLSQIVHDQLDVAVTNIRKRNIIHPDEYNLVYSLFVSEIINHLDKIYSYCDSSNLLTIAMALKATFTDDISKSNSDIYRLNLYLHDFCRDKISNGRIENDKFFYYSTLSDVFQAESNWKTLYVDLMNNRDWDDLLLGISPVQLVYSYLLTEKKEFETNYPNEWQLIDLINYEIEHILRVLQYFSYGFYDLYSKYTLLLIEHMKQIESEKYNHDYAGEYRKLAVMYERSGNIDDARKYEALALEDEKKNSQYNSKRADYFRKRSLSFEFNSIFRAIISDRYKVEDYLDRLIFIENEIYASIHENAQENEQERIEDYKYWLDMNHYLIIIFIHQDDKKNLIFRGNRIINLYENMSKEYKNHFKTEFFTELLFYVTHLIYFHETYIPERVLDKFLYSFESIEDEYSKNNIEADDYWDLKYSWNKANYIINSINHPERKDEINSYKENLSEDMIQQCDNIIKEELAFHHK